MTAEEFQAHCKSLGPTRLALCYKLGISRRSGDAYALGKAPVPLTVALAIAALQAGLEPATSPRPKKKNSTACGLTS